MVRLQESAIEVLIQHQFLYFTEQLFVLDTLDKALQLA